MNRIDEKFQALKTAGKAALMPYLTAGDPDLETTKKLVLAFEEAGADILELGIPFSDPVADGPTIQAASQRALAGGVTLGKIFDLISEIRIQSQLPLCLMGYYNPIYRYGLEAFVAKCAAMGADGLIVPDLPPEEAHTLSEIAKKHDIRLISFIAPTSSPARQQMIVKQASGFIYLVSLTGVTGVRQQLQANIEPMISALRSLTDLPISVGFGVGSPEQAKKVAALADGVIVGSAIINELCKHDKQPDQVEKTAAFVKGLADAVKGV